MKEFVLDQAAREAKLLETTEQENAWLAMSADAKIEHLVARSSTSGELSNKLDLIIKNAKSDQKNYYSYEKNSKIAFVPNMAAKSNALVSEMVIAERLVPSNT